MNIQMTRKDLTLACALGVVCGATLALSQAFFTPGKGILITYAAVIAIIGMTLRGRSSTFIAQAGVAFLSLAIAAILHYAVVAIGAPGVSLAGHVWRLGFVCAICAMVSLPVARIAEG